MVFLNISINKNIHERHKSFQHAHYYMDCENECKKNGSHWTISYCRYISWRKQREELISSLGIFTFVEFQIEITTFTLNLINPSECTRWPPTVHGVLKDQGSGSLPSCPAIHNTKFIHYFMYSCSFEKQMVRSQRLCAAKHSVRLSLHELSL